jgi:LmbE family N-acetylglucosaminyl deacetylase
VKLLVTVAHPDDEAFGCGSVLAHARARGLESVVACATRGELGEPSPALGDEAPSPGQLGAIREAELRLATALLGVSRVEVLGWTDSGVDGDAPEGSLCAVDRADHPPTAVYLWCLPRSLMREFTGVDHLGTPDDDITTVVDASALVDARWQAMRAHRSQVPPYAAMSPGLQAAFLGLDRLRRVRPAWSGGAVEDDWVPATQ